MNTFIAWSQHIVCKIPGCNAHIYSFQEKEHLKTVHNICNRPNSSNFHIYKFLENHNYEDDICSICWDKLNNEKVENGEEQIIHMPNCQHAYHKTCIDESWSKPNGWYWWKPRDKEWKCHMCNKNDVFESKEVICGKARYLCEIKVKNSNILQQRICYNKCNGETRGGWDCTRNANHGYDYCMTHRRIYL